MPIEKMPLHEGSRGQLVTYSKDHKMSKSHLLMSEASAEIDDADALEFVVIGEILQEYIPPVIVERKRMPDPGTWFFAIEGDISRAQECFDGQHRMRIFRVVRGDGATVSTNGHIQNMMPHNGEVFEVAISARGERISKPASLSS